MKCTIEIFIDGYWRKAAEFEVRVPSEIKKGYQGSGFLDYDPDYVEAYLEQTGSAAVSCRFKVNYALYHESAWPAFLLDLLPSGASRRYWLQKLEIKDGPEADWPLLLHAAGNPPGNVRIREAAQEIIEAATRPGVRQEGFGYSDVLAKKETFIEYAHDHGAPVAGSTGAQGDAPKFLLTEDRSGKWHADGALQDAAAAKHWLVKFPRGKQKSDRAILKNEAAYAKVAKEVGLYTGELPRFEENILFVPRFDRKVKSGRVVKLGQESLCSLAGISEFGQRTPQEKLCEALAQHSSDPSADISEFIIRDVFNLAMGNTDNHARNMAVSKYPDRTVRLSPVFDFAPMFLDDQGISRVSRWVDAETLGNPDWAKIAAGAERFEVDPGGILKKLRRLSKVVKRLPETMKACGVDSFLIERLRLRIEDMAAVLGRL